MKKSFIFFFLLAFTLIFNFSLKAQTYFQLPNLPYAYDALEPYIDAQTMQIHYQKHHAAYVNNLNKAIPVDSAQLKIEDILKHISTYSDAVRNNAGGHYNHSLFWTNLTPNKNSQRSKRLEDAILAQYGSVDSLKKIINQEAMKRFGSGWVWLSVGSDKKLVVSSTPNQDNPLMDIADIKAKPILAIDVWEHAYYLKYQNKRGDYLSAIWNVIDWEEVSKRYEVAAPKGKFDDWQALKDFHKVMSQTFHPSEEGDLQPIKTRSKEMILKAEVLKKSLIPAEFNKKEVIKAIDELVVGSKKLDKLISSKSDDAKIGQSLNDLHDVFHKIVGLCTSEDHE